MQFNDLKITISKTSDGKNDYVQIMSRDMLSCNIVLVAPEVEIEDRR